MKRMNPMRTQRGYAMLVAIGVTAVIMIYLVMAQTGATLQFNAGQRQAERLARAELAETALRLAARDALGEDPLSTPLGLTGARTIEAIVSQRPLADSDAAWNGIVGLAPRAGDRLVTIAWQSSDLPPLTQSYLINPGARAGAIELSGAAFATEPTLLPAADDEPTTTAAASDDSPTT